MIWIYGQTSGKLIHDGVIVGKAYSGYEEDHNVHDDQTLAKLGPIPVGKYTIGKFFDDPGGKGAVVAHLLPCEDTETFGRLGFMIHGDNSKLNFSGSEGCIVTPRNVREMIRDSGDTELEVIDDKTEISNEEAA